MTSPSRLWRVLGLTSPLLSVTSPSLTPDLDDHTLSSLTIEAGTTMAGLTTVGATIDAAGVHVMGYTGNDLDIDLTTHGASRLAALTGKSAASITPRFRGRLTGQAITDKGTASATTLTAQDWPALISQLDKGASANASDPSVWTLYTSLFNSTAIPELYDKLVPWGATWPWVRFPPGTPDPFHIDTADVIGKFTADLGILIRQDRAGTPTAWSNDHLRALSDQWSTVNPDPLQRSQVVKPVQWERPSTIPTRIGWTQLLGIGDHDNTGSYLTGRMEPVDRIEHLDLTHIWDIGSTSNSPSPELQSVMRARAYRTSARDLTVNKVTVDVLGLLARNHGTDRAQVGNLLAMNHGDPIALGYDWPNDVAGVYFARKIIHRITPTSWHIDIDLMSKGHVTGYGNTDATPLSGRTWDTAHPPRRDTWATVDDTTTWDQ